MVKHAAMALEPPREHYRISIDCSVTSKEALFSRVTDTAYLGRSSFNGWDAFYDLLWLRLDGSPIELEIDNRDLSGLTVEDRGKWLSVLGDLHEEFPEKLVLTCLDK